MAARCPDPVPGSTPASQAAAALVRAGSRLSEPDARDAAPGIRARRAGATTGVFGRGTTFDHMTGPDAFRLTQYARGGGCACKIPPGELEETIAGLVPGGPGTDLMVGVEHGDDGAVVRVSPAMAVVVTADFFTAVVDDAYTFGRIAATNALSDIYAMGGEPLVR